jgi:O-antigen biosynthesis protein
VEISFIIPLFNRLDVTRPCLESLRTSLRTDLAHEIILVDDGSTDGTREWLVTLPSPPFVVLLNEQNRGYAHANNRAARIARGRYLVLCNNDLLFAPGWLEPMLRAFTRHRDAGIVGNLQLRVDNGALDHAGIVVNLKGKPEHLTREQGSLCLWLRWSRRPAVTGACCLIPRSVYLELGGLDEGFMNGGEDVDFCYRLQRRGLRVLVANRSSVRHHVSASPGRKLRDEHNSRRLCQRWREQLVLDGARSWPKAYLRAHWREPRDYATRLLWQAVLRWCGLVRSPASHACRLVEQNIEVERQRWRALLGPEDTPS